MEEGERDREGERDIEGKRERETEGGRERKREPLSLGLEVCWVGGGRELHIDLAGKVVACTGGHDILRRVEVC